MKTIDNTKAYICKSFAVGIWNANNRTMTAYLQTGTVNQTL